MHGSDSRARRRPLGAVALTIVFAFAATTTTAVAAEKYKDKQDAAAAGDPAATAPVAKKARIKYKGQAITSEQAASQGLSCNEVADEPIRCFDTMDEADAAMGVKAEKHPAHQSKAKPRAKASSHCDAGGPLRTYKLTNQTTDGGRGWMLSLYSRHAWFDMQPGYNNDTSSYGMNAHSGHLSDYTGGGGYWYPGDTGVCGFADYMGNWDNRVGSRYRN
jgi:hypothetical protein